MPRLRLLLIPKHQQRLVDDLVLGKGHLGARQIHVDAVARACVLKLRHVDHVVIVLCGTLWLDRVRRHLQVPHLPLLLFCGVPLGVGQLVRDGVLFAVVRLHDAALFIPALWCLDALALVDGRNVVFFSSDGVDEALAFL